MARIDTMNSSRLQLLAGLAVLGLAVVGGWAATNLLQRNVAITTGIESCWRLEGSGRQVACLSDEFREGARESTSGLQGQSRDAALVAYVRSAEYMAAEDERLAATCHPAMHELGRDEGSRAAKLDRVPEFPEGSSQLCTAGYVHGLSEGYLTGTPSADVAATFPRLCHDAAAREGCAHGIGHALLRARVDDPPLASANGAIERCGELPGDFPTNCMNGVYMELAMRTQPRPVAPNDYVAACRGAADVERSLSCWGYLGLSLTTNDIELDAVPSWCAKADLPGQFTCIDEYGRDLGVERVARCEAVSDPVELRERCVDGAVGLQVGSGHVTPDEAVAACGTLSDRDLASHCTSAVERYLRGRKQVERA
jgi:hypothetical protein